MVSGIEIDNHLSGWRPRVFHKCRRCYRVVSVFSSIFGFHEFYRFLSFLKCSRVLIGASSFLELSWFSLIFSSLLGFPKFSRCSRAGTSNDAKPPDTRKLPSLEFSCCSRVFSEFSSFPGVLEPVRRTARSPRMLRSFRSPRTEHWISLSLYIYGCGQLSALSGGSI